MEKLSDQELEYLRRIAEGDEPKPTPSGYFWLQAPEEERDVRVVNSLLRKGLIVWGENVSLERGIWGAEYYRATEKGKEVLEEEETQDDEQEH